MKTYSYLVLSLLLGCNSSDLKMANAALYNEVQSCKMDLSDTKKENILRKAKYAEIESRLWSTINRCDHKNSRKELLDLYLSVFPSGTFAHIARQEYEIENRSTMELDTQDIGVKIAEILSDPKSYSKREFEKRVCSEALKLSEYGVQTNILELNWRGQKIYNTTCYWDYKIKSTEFTYLDYDSAIEVRMKQEVAKLLAKREQINNKCKYIIDAKLAFYGQISFSHPVMYLKEMK